MSAKLHTSHVSAVLLLVACLACDDKPAKPPAGGPPSKAATGLQAVTGGSEKVADAQAAAAAAGANAAAPTTPPAAPAEAKDDEAAEIAYAYSPIGKRDPFRSLYDQLRREEQNQQLTELQTFEVDQLKLVAIISRIATPYAMVEDPNGKGHTLTRGTLIGKNWGRVFEINADAVVIKEEYRDYTGRKVTNKITLQLPKPDELKVD
jgi:type IV pilus assembly protein PilP